MSTVILVENLFKTYRLGQIGTGTFANDLKVWWAKMRRVPNPLLKIGETDHGNRDGEEIRALNDISFAIKQGEVLGIIGRNGAGKSTLLKILSRVTAPTSGVIKLKGRVASLLEVGTGFHPELTGRENIYLNGAILGMHRHEVRCKFDEIVNFSGVEKFIDTPVKRYSSGMYVRLAFAVAAHLDSEILIVDEVLAVGDAEFQKKCLGMMGGVAKSGRTVIFVSHNMASISALTERTLFLDRGKIVDDDQTDIVIERYLKHITVFSNITAQLDNDNYLLNSVKILSTTSDNAQHSGLAVIGSEDEFQLVIDLTVKSEIRDVVFFIRINDLSENIIYTGLSSDTLGGNIVLKPGHFLLKHTIKLPLRPGEYYLVFGQVDIVRRKLINSMDRILYLNVTHPRSWIYDERPGYILQHGLWDIEAMK